MSHPYSPKEFAKVRAEFPTYGGGVNQRAFYMEITGRAHKRIMGYEVHKDGSHVETKVEDGYALEFVILDEADIKKFEPMRLSFFYGELEKA